MFQFSLYWLFSQGSTDDWGFTPEQFALHNFMQRTKEKVEKTVTVAVLQFHEVVLVYY